MPVGVAPAMVMFEPALDTDPMKAGARAGKEIERVVRDSVTQARQMLAAASLAAPTPAEIERIVNMFAESSILHNGPYRKSRPKAYIDSLRSSDNLLKAHSIFANVSDPGSRSPFPIARTVRSLTPDSRNPSQFSCSIEGPHVPGLRG